MITEKDAQYIANLSRIYLQKNEATDLAKNLEDILQYVQTLNKLDVSGIEPTCHVLPLHNVYREDKTKPSLTQDETLSIAVEKKDGSFKVPKVIE